MQRKLRHRKINLRPQHLEDAAIAPVRVNQLATLSAPDVDTPE